MCPLAHYDGHDAPGLIDGPIPSEAAVVDDVFVGFEDAARQPVVAHELRHVLDRVELRTPRRQRHQRDVGRHDQLGRSVPSGLIELKDRMRPGQPIFRPYTIYAHDIPDLQFYIWQLPQVFPEPISVNYAAIAVSSSMALDRSLASAGEILPMGASTRGY